MNKTLARSATGTIASLLGFVLYDYNTCHPMRKMGPNSYDIKGAFIRLHNIAYTKLQLPSKTFTLNDLAQYDGNSGNRIYFSSEGYVWDATSSEMFRSAYGQWCGKDATFALAKMSLNQNDINRTDYESLTSEELESLHSWSSYFSEKYLIKGRLKEYNEKPRRMDKTTFE